MKIINEKPNRRIWLKVGADHYGPLRRPSLMNYLLYRNCKSTLCNTQAYVPFIEPQNVQFFSVDSICYC